MEVQDPSEIQDEFEKRVRRAVWATVTTVDGILHPIWEGTTAWIATGPNSFKAKHLAKNPYVFVSYRDPQHELVFAECKAEWAGDPDEKEPVWDLVKSQAEPYGYDPGLFFKAGPRDPSFGALRLTPWRIELFSIKHMMQGAHATVWRPA